MVDGAVFGNNLSWISDATIASISPQEASANSSYLPSHSTKVVPTSSLDYLSIAEVIPYVSLIIIGLFEVSTLGDNNCKHNYC
nr:hypothetical protein [Wolbachia endosymbiont of Litomosoides brasiliensis]